MKIAVASVDGTSISQHFGRSNCFLVYDLEGNVVGGEVVRTNTSTAHAQGQCHGEHQHHDHEHGHGDVVAALRDCSAVLCGGMGSRAAEELERHGIRPVVVRGDVSPLDAVRQYAAGLLNSSTGFCRCHE